MANCSRCSAANADMFSSVGDVVCKRCFYAESQAAMDQRAAETKGDDVLGMPVQHLEEQPPSTWMLIGGVVMLVSVAIAAAAVMFVGMFHFAFVLMFGAGLTIFARGLMEWKSRR